MTTPFSFDPGLGYRPVLGDGFNVALGGIRFAMLDRKEWRFYIDLDDRHVNIGGVCHGGALATLADVGMGAAAYRAAGSKPVATIQLGLQYLAGARPGRRLHGRSRLLRHVRDLLFMEADLACEDRHVVHSSGIWKVLAEGGRSVSDEATVAG